MSARVFQRLVHRKGNCRRIIAVYSNESKKHPLIQEIVYPKLTYQPLNKKTYCKTERREFSIMYSVIKMRKAPH